MENGVHAGLGWIDADVLPLRADTGLKIPHMGWNNLNIEREHPLVAGLPTDSDAYFVHSFYVACDSDRDVIATCDYGQPFAAIIASGSIYGMQFHPEKSQHTGQMLLRNFILASPGVNADGQ
jgi:glutamine amidotransferase